MIETTLKKLLEYKDLTKQEAQSAMTDIMNGNFSPIKLAAWLTALRMKGETYQEIAGCASIMIEYAKKIKTNDKKTVDIVGTGGDCRHTINISTASAITAAASGLTVAKHGNKAVSSKSGSADVLSSLGLNINITPLQMEKCLNDIGLAFLFAPLLHPAMKHAMPIRKELGIRTIFNILGPICNPAGIKRAVIGVYEPRLCSLIAKAAKELGYERLLVVCGNDGLDELTTTTTSLISEIINNEIIEYEFNPLEYGIQKAALEDIQGKDPDYNSQLIIDIFKGKIKGAALDIILLNTAAAIIAGGVTESWTEALTIAEETISSGKALEKLNQIIVFTQSL